MPKKKKLDIDNVLMTLRSQLLQGPSGASKLVKVLHVSQPAFSRLIGRLKGELLISGKASKTIYALKREIPEVGNQILIYQIDSKGSASAYGTLFAVHPKGFYFESNEQNGFYDDLPYFLNDLRPAGFLGCLIPRLHSDFNFPDDIWHWSADHCLRYLSQFSYDSIGNLIIGEEAFKSYLKYFQKISSKVKSEERSKKYEQFANDVLSLGDPGSSAGGEQPKFLTVQGDEPTPVIVKFSPSLQDKIGQRRGDLLVCEHIAHQVLKDFGQSSSSSEIIRGENRIFLEIKRFDRTPPRGRKGLISLEALRLEFGEGAKDWPGVAEELLSQKVIEDKIYKKIQFFYLFGNLIANTDMHFGNLSFYTKGLRIKELAPIYDMLPMLYAPQNEQIIGRKFDPPMPDADQMSHWNDCWEAAYEFWKRVSLRGEVSKDFKEIAKLNLEKLRELGAVSSMLPIK